MMEKESTIEITEAMAPLAPKEQLGIYKLVRWTWYKKQMAIQKSTTIIDSVRGITQVSLPDFNTHSLLACLAESPLPLTYETIRDQLDSDIGDLLFDELQKVTGVTGKEKADFSEQPGLEKLTLG